MIQGCEILYPSHITSVKAKKTFKLNVLKESPETDIADFRITENSKVKTNLLFFMHQPNAWYATFTEAFTHTKKNGISKRRQISVDTTCTMLTINVYHNGTIMVQGSENCLDNFQHNFQNMKEEAEKKEKEKSAHLEADNTNKTVTFTTSNNRSVTLSPETTPRFSNSLKTLKERLSVLEREFMEFRERTLVSLHQKTTIDRPQNETYTLILQQRDQIRELQQAMRELEEDNQSLRMMV